MQSNGSNQNKIKVSVILPSLNVHKYISECVDSVRNQTLKDIEIICVDAGSIGGTLEILQEKASADSRIILLHSDIKSYGHQVNMGIDIAQGEYIAIVETDDTVLPEMYELMSAYADSLNADVVKTPYLEHRKDKHKDCFYRKRLANELPKEKTFSIKEYGQLLEIHASVWSGLYRTSYLREKGVRFVEAPAAGYVDVGFRIDSLINTDKLAWFDEPFYCYRVDAEGSSTNSFKLDAMLDRWLEVHKKFEGRKEEYDKYYGPYLILDEYLNTVRYMYQMDTSPAQREKLSNVLSNISSELIAHSESLSNRQKKDLMDSKNDIDAFYEETKWAWQGLNLYKIADRVAPKGSKLRNLIKKLVLRNG